MSKKSLVLFFSLLMVGVAHNASAQGVTSATLSVSGKEVSTSVSEQQLRLNINVNLNRSPTKSCTMTVYSSLTTVGETDDDSRRRQIFSTKIARKSSKRIKLSYSGPAISGASDDAAQANFQVRVKCGSGSSSTTVFSNVDATNVTCEDGINRNQFITQLRRRLRVS